MAITVRNNFPQIVSRLKQVERDVGQRALVKAINKTMQQGKGAMARQISSEYMLTSAEAKGRLRVSRASNKGLRVVATLEATKRAYGRSMNLIRFVERSVTLAEGRKRAKAGTLQDLRFQIKRTGGKKNITGAFIANKGRTVFVRQGKERLPIAGVMTIDLPQMFNARKVREVVERIMVMRLDANFERELRALLQGYAK